MKEFLQYILYSGICLGIFWIVYRFLLNGTTFFLFNRVFLFVGLVLSFILPSFVFTYDVMIPSAMVISTVPQDAVRQESTFAFDGWVVAACVYLSGIVLLVFRNLRSYIRMYRLVKNGNLSMYGGYKVILNSSVDSPFTLFGHIFLNADQLSEIERELILKHEIVHIDQKHWLDLICSECALTLQWFNPFVWLYVSSIKENHEFQADNAVLAAGVSPARYRAVLVNQRFKGPVFSFANSFSLLNKSNRLKMIKKEKSKSWKRAAVLAVLPLLGVFFWASAKPRYVFNETYSNGAAVNDTTGQKKINIKIIGAKGSNSVTVHNLSGNTFSPLDLRLSTNADSEQADSVKTNVYVFGAKSDQKEKPLLFVDGKEIDMEKMNDIDPNDIERIDVLKDKSATEKYGEKGKNGVILITIKKKE